jgi:1,4-alpha-glucan branching enzyme
MIAEDLQGWGQITAPVASGGLGFSTQWNESLCYALRNAVIPASDEYEHGKLSTSGVS